MRSTLNNTSERASFEKIVISVCDMPSQKEKKHVPGEMLTKKNMARRTSPGWWHRRLLKLLFPQKQGTQAGAIPSEKNLEISWVTPTNWVTEKIVMLKWVGQAETLTVNPSHIDGSHTPGRELPSLSCPREAKSLDHTLAPQLLRLPPEG